MKLKTNSQKLLNECINTSFTENDNFNNVTQFFEYFATSQILKDEDLSDDEIINGITGEGGDGGIDAFYIFVNGVLVTEDMLETLSIPRSCPIEVMIVQTKYVSSFTEEVIQKWKTISDNLFVLEPLDKYKTRYNVKIIENFTLLGKVIKKAVRSQCLLEITFHYATLGLTEEIHPNVFAQKEELVQIVKGKFPAANVNVNFWGADQIFDAYNRAPETTVELTFAEQPISIGPNDMVALVNLVRYYDFIVDENGNINKRFFEANVRDYQGSNTVNKSIEDTLLNKDSNEDFWWFNNGVTILVSGLTRITNKSITLVNPEIVNGLQTSSEIFNFFNTHPGYKVQENRNVLVRIVKPNDESSRDKIIFATNNQTNIPQYSLRVTDKIHIEIELYLKSRGLYYDRRKNYYKNQNIKSSNIIGVAFLAQCLISLILKKPDYARARPSTLLADENIYKQLYGTNHELELYYKAAKIGKEVKAQLNKTQLPSSAKNDILFYVMYVVMANLLRKKEIGIDDLLRFDLALLNETSIQEAIDFVNNCYIEQGSSGRVVKSKSFIEEIDKKLVL